jgi:hypothetical protein
MPREILSTLVILPYIYLGCFQIHFINWLSLWLFSLLSFPFSASFLLPLYFEMRLKKALDFQRKLARDYQSSGISGNGEERTQNIEGKRRKRRNENRPVG